jgi:hypothetical protein
MAIGVNLDGERDVLGMWLGPTGGEGAKQWMTMLTELRNRGVGDALIVCCDGLKGLPDAIRVTWPDATVQTCVVHMVRNSLRYASKKHWAAITRQMRAIYTAPTVEAAQTHFSSFADTWRDLYPAMIGSWETAWEEFVPFLAFPVELRKIVYTTKRHRESQRPVPAGGPPSWPFPQRAVRHKSSVSGRHATPTEPSEPDRQDQRLEADTQRTNHPLRRPDHGRHQLE